MNTKNYKLTIELVPKTSWYTNVRSKVSKAEWDVIRKRCYKEAGYKCEICNDVGPKWPVECHEIWEYDDEKLTQTLKGLIALCPDCHKVKHPGLAGINGQTDLVLYQLSEVNQISIDEAISYLESCFDLYRKRSQFKWDVCIKYLDNYQKINP